MEEYKILFADDDDFIRKIYGDRFAASGIDATLISSVEDAKDILEKRSFDLVCIDYLFVRQSGLDLLQWIRNDKQLKMPVIIFSASGQDADRQKFMEAGATEYVQKDQIKPSELVIKIKSIITTDKNHA